MTKIVSWTYYKSKKDYCIIKNISKIMYQIGKKIFIFNDIRIVVGDYGRAMHAPTPLLFKTLPLGYFSFTPTEH